MNRNRALSIAAFASLLVTAATPAFAAEDGQLPASVPSQQMQMQTVPAQQAPMAVPAEAPAPASQAMAPAGAAQVHTAPPWSLSQHPNAPLQPRQVGDVTYITGGIGDAEMDQLKSEANNYNLQVTNSDGTGHFTANNNFVITSRDGRELIRVDNAGPLFYAQLPPGQYKVEATHGDKHETRTANVSRKSGKAANIDLIWR